MKRVIGCREAEKERKREAADRVLGEVVDDTASAAQHRLHCHTHPAPHTLHPTPYTLHPTP